MAGTNRFSTPIAVTLLAAVLLGLIAVFVFPPLPLVVVALLLATAFGAGAYGLSRRVAYLKQNQYFGQGNRQGGGGRWSPSCSPRPWASPSCPC
ncbi:hypothetical protein ACFQY4_34625 [Catellatospora bangladeshensis]|uniref:hypothetical protein n=1 Tax=Catellatospora bangladeshensis TaxID=310355 RepID=UPI003605F57D